MAEDTGRSPAPDSTRTVEGVKSFVPPKDVTVNKAKFTPPADVKEVGGVQAKPQATGFALGTPEFEEAAYQTRQGLRTAGYDPTTIEALTTAEGLAKGAPSDLDMGQLYETMRPVFQENAGAIEETWKIAKQMVDEDGMAISALDWSIMRNLMGIYANKELNLGGKGVAGLAETRSWWKKLHRSIGDKFAGTVAEGVMDFSLGLSMLDMFSWVNKKFKLAFVPGDQRAEVEARVLPKITLDDGHEYQLGTSAAGHILGQRMIGASFKVAAAAVKGTPIGLVSVLPNSPLKDIVESVTTPLEERGDELENRAVGQVPTLVASLGPHLTWQEVVERNWDPVMDLEKFYQGLNDMGRYGEMEMVGWVGLDAIAEIAFDPMLVFGIAAGKFPALARGLVQKVAPGKAAQITSSIARRTNRLEDALDAVKAATADLDKAEAFGRSQAAATDPARMSMEAAEQIILKRRQLADEMQWLSRFEDAGPNEQIMLRSARRTKEALPPTSKIEEYVDLAEGVGGPNPIRADFPVEKQAAMFKEVQELLDAPKTLGNQERLATLGDELGRLGVLSDEEAGVVGRLVNERNNLTALSKAMARGANKKPVLDRLASINKEINNVLEKGRENFVLLNKVTKSRKVPRDINEVTKELDEMRRAAIERDADATIDWNKVDDLPLFQRRAVLGPDDVEQAGDALNHMTRTGGVGIDDVASTPTNIEYGAQPASQQGLINWRLLDLQNDVVKAEREFATIGKQYVLGTSSKRVIARQVHVARKALGLLRKQKGMLPKNTQVADRLRVFEKELVDLKAAYKKIPKNLKDDFDDSWLPPAQDAIMDTPARFNSWLEKAGDTAVRSLYPGGLVTSHFGNTKTGQIVAPLREPQRFMETYDPALWDRVRSGHLRQRQMQTAFFDEVQSVMETAGVMTKRGKWNPKKDWSPYVINKQRNEQLFNLLDEPIGTEAWKEMAEAADVPLMKAHDAVRKLLDHAADQQGISATNKYLTGYIRHVITKDQFANGARPIEYIGLPTKAEVFASHLMDRAGAPGYPRDAVLALDMYARGFSKKLVMEPVYDDLVLSGAELSKKHNNPMFQTYMNDLVHQLKGKPQFIGRKLDEMIGGPLNANGEPRWQPNKIDRVIGGITGLMYTGALGANPRYPIMQIATGIATTAGRFGLFRTSKALFMQATKEGQAINKTIGTYQEFLDIFESDFARKLTGAIARRVPAISPMGVTTTAQTETFIRGVTAHAAIDMYMTKFGFTSWSEARAAGFAERIAFEALRAAEEVNHMFGALGRSAFATRTFAPTKGVAIGATQFLSFIPKQTEELLSQMNRSPGKIMEYMAISGWISRLAAEELGIDLTSYVGLGYGPEKPSDMTSPGVDVFMKGMDVMDAMSKMDPKGTSDAVTQYLSSAQTLIPAIVAFESAGKAAERLAEGEQKTVLGEKQRELDFLNVLPEVEPSEDPRFTGAKRFQEGGIDALTRAIKPSADPARAAEDPMAGLGGDLIPTIGMQQNIRENVFRRGMRATKREQRRFAFNMQTTIRNYLDAIDDGDEQKQLELEDEMSNTYKIRITGEGPLVKAAQAREISWALRNVLGNQVLLDRFIKVYEDFGLEITP